MPFMVEAARLLGASLPQTRVREVEGAHHAWVPSAFAPVLAAFVRAAASPSGG